MSDTYTTSAPAPAPAAAAPGPSAEEVTQFLDDLEKQADDFHRTWMSARVPAWAREAFEERFPKPEPEEEKAA